MNRITKNCSPKNHISKDKGFTLVELMIGITVSLIVMAGVTQVFVGTIKSSGDTLKASKLNQDLQTIMTIMTSDIRRAGYWDSSAAAPTDTNPFTTINTATAGCILYSYDVDDDGAVDDDERFGFKLNNGNIEMKTIDATNPPVNCTTGTWVIASNDGTETIDTFTFTQSYKCTNASDATKLPVQTACDTPPLLTASGETLVETRRIDILMEGTLSNDNTVTKRIEASVRVRNDRIFTQP